MEDLREAFPQTVVHDAITEAAARRMLRELELEDALEAVRGPSLMDGDALASAHQVIWGRIDELLEAGRARTAECRELRAVARHVAEQVRATARLLVEDGWVESRRSSSRPPSAS
jgi:hypothetical protein